MSSTEAKNHGNHSNSLIGSLHTMIREVLKGNRENIVGLDKRPAGLAPIEPRFRHVVWSTLKGNTIHNSLICLRMASVLIPKAYLELRTRNRSDWMPRSDSFGPNSQLNWSVSPFLRRRETTTRENVFWALEIHCNASWGLFEPQWGYTKSTRSFQSDRKWDSLCFERSTVPGSPSPTMRRRGKGRGKHW